MARANTLFTQTAFAKVPALYATENTPKNHKLAHVKIFSITSDHRHFIIEYDPIEQLAFVLTTNRDVIEYGYLSLAELQEINDNFHERGFRCPPFERELHGGPYSCEQIEAAHSTGLVGVAV